MPIEQIGLGKLRILPSKMAFPFAIFDKLA